MIIKTVCGNGLGSSLLVEMNIKSVLDANGIKYDLVEHTNVNSFNKEGVDWVVVAKDIASSINIEEEKKIILVNILSKDELTLKLKEKIGF